MVEDHPTPNDRLIPSASGLATSTPSVPPGPALRDPAPRDPAPRDPAPRGPTINGGRYVLVSKIAEGGMAGVYRAWDHKMRLWRAIKVLLPEYTQRDILRARFEGEAKTMARLDHPHVIRVYDVGTTEALPYMVMELAEGGTVNAWVDTYGPMPPRLAASVVVQVAGGVAAAHAFGVVHRDVKPHNVLVTSDELCKVTDFGIAHGAVDHDKTRTGATMGTIGYMAPEQRSDARLVDARADVYSLGAMLYKLIVGKVVTDLFLVEHEPKLLEPVPGPLREVVLRACYHDRGRRYSDCHAMIRALNEIIPLLPHDPQDTPSLVLPPPPVSAGSATPSRSPEPFPEIGPLLGYATPKSTPSPPLPYTMPRRMAVSRRSTPPQATPGQASPGHATPGRAVPRYAGQGFPGQGFPGQEQGQGRASLGDSSAEIDDLPDYADPGSLHNPPSLPTVDPSQLPRPDADRDRLDRAERLRQARAWSNAQPLWPPVVQAVLGTVIAIWGITAVLVGVAAWDLREHSLRTASARQRLLQVVDVEQGLLLELSDRGSPPTHTHALNELYEAVITSPDGLPKSHALAAYLSAVHTETASALSGARSTDLSTVRARNLNQAWSAYVRARDDWAQSTHWPHSWLAIELGLASTSIY